MERERKGRMAAYDEYLRRADGMKELDVLAKKEADESNRRQKTRVADTLDAALVEEDAELNMKEEYVVVPDIIDEEDEEGVP